MMTPMAVLPDMRVLEHALRSGELLVLFKHSPT